MTALDSDHKDGVPTEAATGETPMISSSDDPTLVRAAGRAYFPIALVARVPYAMMVVGVLTLVVSARGSLGLGGLTSAMVGLGTEAPCVPRW